MDMEQAPKTLHDVAAKLRKHKLFTGEFTWPYQLYVFIVLSAVLLAWLLDKIFHTPSFGLGVYMLNLFFVIISLVIIFLARSHNRHLSFSGWAVFWLFLGPFFSMWFVLRDSHWLTGFNIISTLLLVALALVNANKERFSSLEVGPIVFLKFFFQSWHRSIQPFRHFFSRFSGKEIEKNLARDIIVALFIGIPIVLVVTALLLSSDLVFAKFFDRILEFFDIEILFEDITHLAVLLYALFFAGALYSLLRIKNYTSLPLLLRSARDRNIISWISIVVGAVLLVFCTIQIKYLFMDDGAVAALGISYADYARQGFYGLMFVSAITFSLSWLLGSRYDGDVKMKDSVAAQIISAILVVETLVVLGSAVQRLLKYIEVYHWTEKRFFALNGMILMAVLLLLFIAHIVFPKFDRKKYAYVFVMLFLSNVLFMNFFNPDHFIAQRNVDAYKNGSQEYEFDFDYTGYISADSYDSGLQLFDLARTDQEKFRAAQAVLRGWCALDRYKDSADNNFTGFHWARETAHKAMQPQFREVERYYLDNREAHMEYDFIGYYAGRCGGYYAYP